MNLLNVTMSHNISYTFGTDAVSFDAQLLAMKSWSHTLIFLTQLFGFVDSIYEKLHLYS